MLTLIQPFRALRPAPGRAAAGATAARFARAADTALSNRYDPSKIARAGECTLMTKPAARSKRRL